MIEAVTEGLKPPERRYDKGERRFKHVGRDAQATVE